MWKTHQKPLTCIADVYTLLKTLENREYQMFVAVHKKELDLHKIQGWWRLIPPKNRRSVKKRLLLMLLWQTMGYKSRKHFLSAWKKHKRKYKKKDVKRTRSILRKWRRHLGTAGRQSFLLIDRMTKDKEITKQDFYYLWKLIPPKSQEKIMICWWACIEENRNVVNTINTKDGSAIEIELTTINEPSHIHI